MAEPTDLGRPGYNPALHVKLYIYGYLNRIQSSRRLERECQRNLEVMWPLGQLAPDHKTIADFRKDNGAARARERAGKPIDWVLGTADHQHFPGVLQRSQRVQDQQFGDAA